MSGAETDPDTARTWAESRARRWTLACLVATAALAPLVFVPGFQDAYALPKLALLYGLVPAALAGPLFHLAVSPTLPHPTFRWPDLAAVAFALFAVIATLASPSPAHALQGEPLQYQGLLPLLLCVAGYGLARVAFSGPRDILLLFAAVALSGAVAGVYALLQQVGLDPIWHGLDRGRVFSTLGQASNLGAYLVLALPPAVMFASHGRWPGRLAACVAATVMVTALLVSLSRGAYLGLGIECVVGAVLLARAFMHQRVPRRALSAGLLGVGAAALLVVAAPQTRGLAERAWERATSGLELADGSVQARLDLWVVGTRIALDHPLLGTGPDSFALEFPTYRDNTLPTDRAQVLARFRPESPHNVYLAIGDGLGLPGLATYLVLVAGALGGALRVTRGADSPGHLIAAALLVAIAGHLVTDAFMTGELAGSWSFWVLLGAVVTLAPVRPTGAGRDWDTRVRSRIYFHDGRVGVPQTVTGTTPRAGGTRGRAGRCSRWNEKAHTGTER